ncbi:hypothetical protein [Paenibacillus campi]|uniref:hypothetical protein n=1 Tax=Paenibacillus campi TaxID=3106031 RepID=UPI002AFE5859|nr:hypothetical protein [Paenibacillus sp. SGZ-1014]
MKKTKYYKSFSINMNRFILAHDIHPVGKSTHKESGRDFWIYEMNDKLSQVLTAWSSNRPTNKNN